MDGRRLGKMYPLAGRNGGEETPANTLSVGTDVPQPNGLGLRLDAPTNLVPGLPPHMVAKTNHDFSSGAGCVALGQYD